MGCGNSVQQHEGVETGPEKRSDLPLELTGCPDDGSVSNQDDQFQSFRVNAGNALFQSAFVFPEITALGSTVPGSSTRAMCMNQKKVKMAFDLRSPEGVHNVAMRQLSAGFLGLQRGPPMEEIVCFDTEMMPPFSLNVTVSDLSAPPSPSSLSNHDASGKRKKRAFQQVPEASRLLAEEAVPVTCQPGSRVRCIGGFKKPLTAMSITRDERLLAGVMGAGKPISGQGFTEEAETEQVKRPTYSVDTFKQESFDRAIKLLDLRTLQAVGVFKEREGVMRTKFLKFIWAQDVALVASTAEGLLRVFNVGRMCKDNDILADGFTFPEMLHITCLAVSFCEHFIAVGGLVDAPSSNLMVQVWRVGDTAKSSSFQQYSKFSQHQENVISVAFRRSSEAVASIDFAGRLLLWDVEHGRIITEILLNQPGNLVYAEGYLTCACRSMIHCWREENGEEGLWNLKFRQIWKKTVKGEAEPMDELVEPPTDTSKGSGGKGTLDNVPTSPLGQAPGDRGQMLRYRSIVLIPGNALLVLSTCKELAILNLEDGSIIDELVLRTIPVAVAVGRTLCIVSDAWGNVYAIDLNLVVQSPAGMQAAAAVPQFAGVPSVQQPMLTTNMPLQMQQLQQLQQQQGWKVQMPQVQMAGTQQVVPNNGMQMAYVLRSPQVPQQQAYAQQGYQVVMAQQPAYPQPMEYVLVQQPPQQQQQQQQQQAGGYVSGVMPYAMSLNAAQQPQLCARAAETA